MINIVWVYRGYGHWEEFPSDSPTAIAYAKSLEMTSEQTRQERRKSLDHFLALRKLQWKRRKQVEKLPDQWIRLAGEVNLFERFLKENHKLLWDEASDVRQEFVTLSDIIPTQPEVNQVIVDWYTNTRIDRDENGKLPFALRFVGDQEVYLTQGHHRYASRLQMKIGMSHMMFLNVQYIPMTFNQVCGKPADIVDLLAVLLEAVA